MKKQIFGLLGLCGLLGFGFSLKPAVASVKAEETPIAEVEPVAEATPAPEQVENESKDWKDFFSVESITAIVTSVLNGGLLLAIVRYFIKDKRLEQKVENKVESTISKIIPDATERTVVKTIETVIAPVVTDLNSKMLDIEETLKVFSKCMALMQENTPESRRAIIDELSGLSLGNSETLTEVKLYIEKAIKEALEEQEKTLKKLDEIKNSNKQIIEEEQNSKEEPKGENGTYDGTTI